MKKIKILVVALGYPTKENPFAGSFFKEQVDFLSTRYDCSVLVYNERTKGLLVPPRISYSEQEYTKGIIQYYPLVYVTAYRRCLEFIGSLYKKKNKNEESVGIYRADSYIKYRKKQIRKIITHLNLSFDIVYCISAQGSVFQASIIAESRKKPLVVSEHRPYPHPGWSTIDVEKKAIESADCFFAIGKDKIRQIMLQDIKPKRIAYIGNMVDEEAFFIDPIEHDYPTLLIVGAYSYFKNYDMFIDTINKLTQLTNRYFKVLVAGYGANKGYAKNEELLEQKIRESNFSDRIELIKVIPRDSMCKLYNRADALVITSIQEGQPMVALEAACCGLPIFSTRCGGVEDYVTNDIGRIVDITDSEGMANNLSDFIEGRIIFNKENIRKTVVNLFGKEAFMNKIGYEFERLMK